MNFCSFDKKFVDSIYDIEKSVFTDNYSVNTLNHICEDELYKYSVVLTIDKDVIAYIIVYEIAGEAEIHRIAVDDKFRKKGFGELILKKCIDELINDNIACLHLEVRKNNYIANCLYKNLGFELVGVRKGYYSDNNEDALLYTLNLVRR